jgi:signal transduction histidine kinase
METTSELNFITTILPFTCIVFIIALGVILLNQQFRKKLHRKLLEQEAMKTRHQEELLRSSIAIQEEERRRFAQNLHDELGAVLSISRMHLVQLEQRNPAETAALQNVRSLTETALASMRRISHELMPLRLEAMGLVKTLEAVATEMAGTGHIQIMFSSSNQLPDLSQPIQLGLYRVVMELINNTLKHSKANEIRITLESDTHNISCRYADNGKGISEEKARPGLGLKGIEGRIHALHGTLQYGNAPAGGFYADIRVPQTTIHATNIDSLLNT